ncbi:hypothetical protein JB92DRAFT_2021210 [Gautieria morchelliformis]|nr:hypothetical protein JB92DRAFT_2021210 [Gautieria morchelliformis]
MSSVVPHYHPPPAGVNYISSLSTSYTFVLISLPFSSILIPILLLIFFFSTPTSRKTLLFALNIIIVLLGMVEGVLNTIVQSIIILHPEHPVDDSLFLSSIGLALYTPIIVDCILILRLSAVYPASVTPRTCRIPILAVPQLCTIARVICVSLFVRQWAIAGLQSSALMASDVVWPQNPLIIADWSIQLFENFYCSTLFLSRLRGHKVFSSRMYRQQSIAARLRAVFYIATSNFCIPAFLGIFQLTFVLHDRDAMHSAMVLTVNNYISIIGIVFCTLWCASDVWKDTHNHGSSFGPNYPEVAFRQSVITLSGIAPNINLSPMGPRFSSNSAYLGSQPVPHGHRFSRPLHYDDRKDVDVESGVSLARDFASNANGEAPDPYFQTLTTHHITGDVDPDQSADSHSPTTPHDVRGLLGSKKEKAESRWDPAMVPPRGTRSLGPGSHLDLASSVSGSDIGLEIDFATDTPPPLPRRYERASLSLSDSSDYHGREIFRHRDIGDISVPPVSAEDESRQAPDIGSNQ